MSRSKGSPVEGDSDGFGRLEDRSCRGPSRLDQLRREGTWHDSSDEATGWGIGWRLNLWARLGDGEHAHRILNLLLQPQRTYPNLLDAHPPFQIDGNFGGTSGIAEMLMQSWGGEIHLLPALPAAWPDGSISGLRARGAVELALRWRKGRLLEVNMHSDTGGQYLLRYGPKQLKVHLSKRKGARVGLDSNGGLVVT